MCYPFGQFTRHRNAFDTIAMLSIKYLPILQDAIQWWFPWFRRSLWTDSFDQQSSKIAFTVIGVQCNVINFVVVNMLADGLAPMMTSSNGNIFRVTGPLCGEFTGPGEFPTQRPVTRSFDVFFDLRVNKRLSKQSRGWWFETPASSLWRHCND